MKISIITVSLNNRTGLETTLKSVIGQTYSNIELIVIDGGSTDGSAGLLNQYKSGIAKGISEKDSGIYNAMNKGIRNATGDYCLFLNSGDELYEQTTIEMAVSLSWNAGLVYGDLAFISKSGSQTISRQPELLSFSHLFIHTLFHPATFIKRNLFEQHGMYDEQLTIVSDYDLFFRFVVMKGVSTMHIKQLIAKHYMDGISSIDENQPVIQQERNYVHLKYLPPLLVEELSHLLKIKETRAFRLAELLHAFRKKIKQ